MLLFLAHRDIVYAVKILSFVAPSGEQELT